MFAKGHADDWNKKNKTESSGLMRPKQNSMVIIINAMFEESQTPQITGNHSPNI